MERAELPSPAFCVHIDSTHTLGLESDSEKFEETQLARWQPLWLCTDLSRVTA